MNGFDRFQIVGTLVLVLVLITTAALTVGAEPAGPEGQDSQSQSLHEERFVELRYDPSGAYAGFRVPPPPGVRSGLSAQSATIVVNYLPEGTVSGSYTCHTWSADARRAFNYAKGIWESLVDSPVPIVIDACWTDMSAGVLGGSGTYDWYANFPGAPKTGLWYPVSLASALQGTDKNDVDGWDTDGDGSDVDPETYIYYNRNYDWYYGTDGNTPGTKLDFASVVLHEICHSLGFAGSMAYNSGVGRWNWGSLTPPVYPAIWDDFTEKGGGGGGTPLVDYGNNTVPLGSVLTSQDVFFDGANANAANSGTPPELYTPSVWQSGSSYSHLDESFNGTAHALMTYSLGNGESQHSPGAIVLGILKDMGWPNPADLRVGKQAVGPDPEPGDPVTFTIRVENVGGEPAANVRITDTLSSDVMTPTWTGTGGVSLVGGTYVWGVSSMAAGAVEVITVEGWITDTLPTTYTLWNTVYVGTTSYESETGNNQSTAAVGGWRVYLPVTLRDY